MKEDFFTLVKRLNAYSFLGDDKEPKAPVVKPKKGHNKVDRLIAKIAELSPEQQQALGMLMAGKAALLNYEGAAYTIRKVGDSWVVQKPGGEAHTVTDDVCSCPDAKFRERECKHLKMLKELL